MKETAFYTYHPLVTFLYFLVVMLFSVLLFHPVFLGIGLVFSFCYTVYLKGFQALKGSFIAVLPIILLISVFNSLFNHKGVTILFYLFNNPITLESVAYGFSSSLMLVTVIFIFVCYNEIMTTDKFIYLFNKISPALSLIISMTIGLIPKMKHQITLISNAQKSIGNDPSFGSAKKRINIGLQIVSILTTWSLENSIETADSMKARGYGLPGRTSYQIFEMEKRDYVALGILFLLVFLILFSLNYLKFQFYPSIKFESRSPGFYRACISFIILFCLPMAIEGWEAFKWKFLI